jgi:hypothetical protein
VTSDFSLKQKVTSDSRRMRCDDKYYYHVGER